MPRVVGNTNYFDAITKRMKKNYCPTCGYEQDEDPWKGKSPSFEICLSCGTQFGYQDAIRFTGTEVQIKDRYDELRKKWIEGGMKWSSVSTIYIVPENWNPKRQLLNIGIEL
jgi:hypothetical protein